MLIYDGDCGFCTRAAEWGRRHLEIEVAPWQQADLGVLGLTAEQCQQAVQWALPPEAPIAGSAAVAAALKHGGGWWPTAGRLLDSRPLRGLAASTYRFVAARRHRLPGHPSVPNACTVSRPTVGTRHA